MLSTVVRSLERCPIDEVIVVAGPHATALVEALREELLFRDPSLAEGWWEGSYYPFRRRDPPRAIGAGVARRETSWTKGRKPSPPPPPLVTDAHARASAEPRTTDLRAAAPPGTGRLRSVRLVVNDRYRDGMLSSVQRGLAAAAPDTTWFVIVLVDQPMIEPAIVTRLLEATQTTTARIVLPTFEGRRGHPILFHADLAAEVTTLSGAIGLRELLQRHPEAILHVPVASDTILRDLDTPEEYERERARFHDGPVTGKEER